MDAGDSIIGLGDSRKLTALLHAGVRHFVDLTMESELAPYSHLLEPLARSLMSSQSLPLVKGEKTYSDVHIVYHRVPIRDRTVPDAKRLESALSLLETLESSARYAETSTGVSADSDLLPPRTAIHCRGGVGRTGTIVACYLVSSNRVTSGSEALDVLKSEFAFVEKRKRYPMTPETGPQCDFVRSWKRDCA